MAGETNSTLPITIKGIGGAGVYRKPYLNGNGFESKYF